MQVEKRDVILNRGKAAVKDRTTVRPSDAVKKNVEIAASL